MQYFEAQSCFWKLYRVLLRAHLVPHHGQQSGVCVPSQAQPGPWRAQGLQAPAPDPRITWGGSTELGEHRPDSPNTPPSLGLPHTERASVQGSGEQGMGTMAVIWSPST
jgi:hypothetical protein